MKKFLLLLFFLPTLVKCENLDSLQKKFNKAKVKEVYLLASGPTEPDKQNAEKRYLHDYEILKPIKVKSGDKKKLLKSLMDSQNYSQKDAKRCPFLGKYGVKLDNSLDLVVSAAPCSKILIFAPGTPKEESYDLGPDNGIEATLGKLEEN